VPTRVKICGLTRPEDAQCAAEAGADAIGLVFYPKSARHIHDLGLAREIAAAVGPFVSVVGLVVNSSVGEIEALLEHVPLSLIQFHGDETQAQCLRYQHPFIKALRMKPGIDIEAEMSAFSEAQGILLDSYVPGIPGGTGESFEWSRVPRQTHRPVILAGGLTPDNVARGVAASRPYAVDVSGGVESAPGIKSAEKINAFIRNAKLES